MNIPICRVPITHPVNLHRLVIQFMASRTSATEKEVLGHVMQETHGAVNPNIVLQVIREITSPSTEIIK